MKNAYFDKHTWRSERELYLRLTYTELDPPRLYERSEKTERKKLEIVINESGNG